jgi:hypothetical protein
MPKIPALPPYSTFSKDDQLAIEDVSGPDTQSMTLEQLLGFIYPVGSIYTNASVSTNPAMLLGFGTWVAFASGRVLVGVDAGQTEFDTLGETGGAKTHTLTSAEVPSHLHTVSGIRSGIAWSAGASRAMDPDVGGTQNTSSSGSGGAHNNLQPYITVYMWRRTA